MSYALRCSYTATKEDIEALIVRTRDFINRIEALIKEKSETEK